MGEQLAADDRGEMLERDGDRQIEFGRPAFGQRKHIVNAAIDAFDIVAVILHQPVEGDMLARVVDFLACERLDLGGEPRREIGTESLERVDEEGFAARQAGAHRIVPGGGDRIVRMPPARGLVLPVEALVAHDQRVFFGGGSTRRDLPLVVGPAGL